MKLSLFLMMSFFGLAQAQSFFNAEEKPAKEEAFFADKPAEGAADAVMTFEAAEKTFNVRESHWGLNLNVSAAQYRPNYKFRTGAKHGKSFDNEDIPMFGPSIEFGRDYHLTPRIVASTKIQAYYYEGNKKDDLVADETLDVAISSLKTDANSTGIGISQMLGHDFKYSSFIIRPYMNYAVGYARTNSKINYNYELLSTDYERLSVDISDAYVYNSLSAGLEVISGSGIAFNLTVSRTGALSGKAKIKESGSSTTGGSIVNTPEQNRTVESNSGEAAYSAALGLGYYF